MSTIVRVLIAAVALAVAGSCMALMWDKAPVPPVTREEGGVHAPGAKPEDYVLLDLEKTARRAYCAAQGGTPIGDQALRCDFGLCTSGRDDELCGVREVVCDDIPDAHQCGLMSRAATSERDDAPRSGDSGPADGFDPRAARDQ